MIDLAPVSPHMANSPFRYELVKRLLVSRPRRWLVSGSAGFIGSNLVETLLTLGQEVVGLDNLVTGRRRNLESVVAAAGPAARRFWFVEGDVRDLEVCREAMRGVDFVLHQAAIGSVPRSIDDPLATHDANVNGTVNMLEAARRMGVSRFVYACSSSTYGDHQGPRKVEEEIGRPLSPYSASKRVGEIYAGVFQRTYGLETVGLRYFNVFGRRQDPEGQYAAVIPRWISLLLAGERCEIYGDGETSRDFCYVDNVIQANLLAALAPGEATDEIYNIACGQRTTLNALYDLVRRGLSRWDPDVASREAVYRDFRTGDVRHSVAAIDKARRRLGYVPTHSAERGLEAALEWYVEHLAPLAVSAPTSDSRGAAVAVVVQELLDGGSPSPMAGTIAYGTRQRMRWAWGIFKHPRPAARGVIAALLTPRWLGGERIGSLLGILGSDALPGPAIGSDAPASVPPTWKISQAAAYLALRQLSRLPGDMWRDTCLYRSVASCLILRNMEVDAYVRVGVRREQFDAGTLPAHAWTVAGDTAVTPVQGDLVPFRPPASVERPGRPSTRAGVG